MIDLFASALQPAETAPCVPAAGPGEPSLVEHILVEDIAVARETASRFRFAERISSAKLGPTSAMFGSD